LTILAGYIYIQIIDYVDDRRRKKNKWKTGNCF
jgi:hypothetical protein